MPLHAERPSVSASSSKRLCPIHPPRRASALDTKDARFIEAGTPRIRLIRKESGTGVRTEYIGVSWISVFQERFSGSIYWPLDFFRDLLFFSWLKVRKTISRHPEPLDRNPTLPRICNYLTHSIFLLGLSSRPVKHLKSNWAAKKGYGPNKDKHMNVGFDEPEGRTSLTTQLFLFLKNIEVLKNATFLYVF